MAFFSGYSPKAYSLVLYPSQGTVYLSDGARAIPVDQKRDDLPIVIPLKPAHWCNAYWKTDICPGILNVEYYHFLPKLASITFEQLYTHFCVKIPVLGS